MKQEDPHNCINLDRTREHIKKFGLSVNILEATNYLPSFAYSTGLWETYKHPEIICFGLPTSLLHEIINDVAGIIKSDGEIRLNHEYLNIFQDSRAQFLDVDSRNITDYFGVTIEYYKTRDFPALQLIWTDRNDKFPWEPGFEEEFKYIQPLLDRNADFKFREPQNLGIFTTIQWLKDNAPIVRVIHEEDGDWQFLTRDIDFENGKLVSLSSIVKKDSTLNEIFNLDYGEEAERQFIGGKWIRRKFEDG